ncbi:MAG TPA: HAD-IIA family hydrolase [Terrabacter sp.]|nr:HAD-IIA family hydrolase [Terrabacter sp.]
MSACTASQPIVAAYDGLVCDLDGVVYRGGDAVPGAPEALQRLVADGIRLVYATNNASRVAGDVAAQLASLGAPATDADVVSSAQAGAARLRGELPAGARVLALGGAGVAQALTGVGLVPVQPADVDFDGMRSPAHPPARSVPAAEVSAVLQGFGRNVSVGDFEIAARLLTLGPIWVGTNDDATLPLPWGQSPGNGAYLDLLAVAAGRRPVVVGKPHPPLYRLALDRLGTPASRTLAVGDRLATDIDGARAADLDSAWVLTGVDLPSDLVVTQSSPTYVIAALGELLEPYAVPQRVGDEWRCGRAAVAHADAGLVVRQGSSDPMETVRAGLAALLEARDTGATPARLRDEARTLDRVVEQLLAGGQEPTDHHDDHGGHDERSVANR